MCIRSTEGENGNVIEKVEEVKEIQREEEKVSGLCCQPRNYTSETFSRKLGESCRYRRADCARGGNKRKKKNLRHVGLPLPSRWRPGNHAPLKGGDIVHALWLHCVHARVGRCEHTGVALGLHLPVCVYLRGIHRGPINGDDDVQQLEFHRERCYDIAPVGHEVFNRCSKVRR